MTEETIFGVYVSSGSAETLVRRGVIRNHHLIAYSLDNISAKNYQVMVWYISVIFLRHSVEILTSCVCLFDVCMAVIFSHSVVTSNNCLHLNRMLLARSYIQDVIKKAMTCMPIALLNFVVAVCLLTLNIELDATHRIQNHTFMKPKNVLVSEIVST